MYSRFHLDDVIWKVIESLDRASHHARPQCPNRRKHGRRRHREIAIALCVQPPGDDTNLDQLSPVQVWIRNISRDGIGFLHHELFSIGDDIIIRLQLQQQTVHLRGRIVRRREVEDDFWEYGAEFLGQVAV